jgi:hypothetical protein
MQNSKNNHIVWLRKGLVTILQSKIAARPCNLDCSGNPFGFSQKIGAESPVFGAASRAGHNFAQQNCCPPLRPAKNAPKFLIFPGKLFKN